MSDSTIQDPSSLSAGARISNLVVQVLHSHTGRGPTKAWTSIDHNLVTVVVRDTLTKGEQTLVSGGSEQLVLDMRKTFHHIMRSDLVSGVESITGREVLAFLSDNHIDPDVAVESFVLVPVADDGRPPAIDGRLAAINGRPAGDGRL